MPITNETKSNSEKLVNGRIPVQAADSFDTENDTDYSRIQVLRMGYSTMERTASERRKSELFVVENDLYTDGK